MTPRCFAVLLAFLPLPTHLCFFSVWCNPASTVCHFFVVNGQAPMFLDVFDSSSAGIWQYVTKFSVRYCTTTALRSRLEIMI